MGFYDRDYYRQPTRRGRFGSFSAWSVTTWLIIINVAVYLLDMLLWNMRARQMVGPEFSELSPRLKSLVYASAPRPLEAWGYFSMATAIYKFQFWRFFTFQFLHANFSHLASNMLGLFFFGPIVEAYFGWKRYLAFYLLCGMSGALFYMLLLATGFLVGSPMAPLVGASAGIFGVLIAAAMIAPDVEVMLLFPPIPMRLKVLALIMFGIAVWTAFGNGYNAGGEAAHLGGAALGFLFIRYPWLLNVFDFSWRRRRMRLRYTDWSKDPDH